MNKHNTSIGRPTRLFPNRPLPPYSYVSRHFPHPTREVGGHSYGCEEPKISIDYESQWQVCDPYRWGIDLFNCGYYWEAHESWEAVWHGAGRRGPIADFCKALIKLAAAGVKAREGRVNGVRQHAKRAKQLLESVAARIDGGARFMGLSIPTMIEYAERLVDNPDAVINQNDAPVVVVMPFILQAE